MMVPNQIKNFNFQPAGRGTYKAADVDAFKQKMYTAYSELFSENSALKSKFASLANLVEEYNEGKNAIATTMIKAQTFADETIKEATAKAEQIVAKANADAEQTFNQKKLEADAYVSEKTADADSYYSRAQSELDVVLQKASKEAEAYIASVNEKAAAIIANANEQASKIVSAAYVDAQKARTTCDDIVEQANAKLAAMKAEVAEFRKETKRLLSIITPVVDDIDVPDDLPSFNVSSASLDEQGGASLQADSEIEPFKFDPYAASAINDEPQEVVVPVVETTDEIVDENTSEVTAEELDESTPSIISEKLSASIFKSLDDFDRLVDMSANGEDIKIYDDSKNSESEINAQNSGYDNNTGLSPIGKFDITDFNEE